MKVSPILHPYYSSTNKSKNTSFKRDVTTKEDINSVLNSPLKDSEKKLILEAYKQSRDYLENLDADINLHYSPNKEKKSWFSNEYLFPEEVGFLIRAKNRSRDITLMSVDVIEDVKKGTDVDTLVDKIKLMTRDTVDYIKKCRTYYMSDDDDFYTDNTGKWDLTDAYIP